MNVSMPACRSFAAIARPDMPAPTIATLGARRMPLIPAMFPRLDTGRLVCMFGRGDPEAGRPRRARPARTLARPVAVETARRTKRELGVRLRALREGEPPPERPVLDPFDP